jgi:hypothetical protein
VYVITLFNFTNVLQGEESDEEEKEKEEKKPTVSSWVHQPVRHVSQLQQNILIAGFTCYNFYECTK